MSAIRAVTFSKRIFKWLANLLKIRLVEKIFGSGAFNKDTQHDRNVKRPISLRIYKSLIQSYLNIKLEINTSMGYQNFLDFKSRRFFNDDQNSSTKRALVFRIIQDYPLIHQLLRSKAKLSKLVAIFIINYLQFSSIIYLLISKPITPDYYYLKILKKTFESRSHSINEINLRKFLIALINYSNYILYTSKTTKIFSLIMDIGMLRYNRTVNDFNSTGHINTGFNLRDSRDNQYLKSKSLGWKLDKWINPEYQGNNSKKIKLKKKEPQTDIDSSELYIYVISSTEAKMTLASAPALLDKYNNSLNKKRYSSDKLDKSVKLVYDHYQGTINFPRDCPINQITGDLSRSKKVAMQKACWKSIVELHRLKALDDNLNPIYCPNSSEGLPGLSGKFAKDSFTLNSTGKSEAYTMKTPKIFKEEILLNEDSQLFFNRIDLKSLNNIDCDIIPKLLFITNSPLSEDLKFTLYIQGEKAQVLVNPIGASLSLSVQQIKTSITFTKELLKHSLPNNFDIENFSPKFLILPLGSSDCALEYLDWKEVEDFLISNFEKTEENFEKNTVIRDNLNYGTVNAVKSVFEDANIDSIIPFYKSKITFRELFSSTFKTDKKSKNMQEILKVEKVNRVKNHLTSELSLEDAYYGERIEYSLSQFSKTICHSVNYYKTSQIIPSMIYCIHHLALSSEVKQILSEPRIDVQQLSIAFTDKKARMSYSYQKLSHLGDSFLKLGATLSVYCNNPSVLESELHLRRNYIFQNNMILPNEKNLALPSYYNKTPLTKENFSLQLILNNIENTSYDIPNQYLKDKSLIQNAKAIIGACVMSKDTGKEELAFDIMAKIVYPMSHNWATLKEIYKNEIIDTDISHLSSGIKSIENAMSYKFKNKYLLIEALTHNSYSDKITNCYERLEFLGDAILEYFICFYLYKNYPNIDVKDFSGIKSKCASNSFLLEVCIQAGLDRYIFVSNINKRGFVKSCEELFSGKNQLDLKYTKIPSDVIEALIAAVFLDSYFNIDVTYELFNKLIVPIIKKFILAHKSSFYPQNI